MFKGLSCLVLVLTTTRADLDGMIFAFDSHVRLL